MAAVVHCCVLSLRYRVFRMAGSDPVLEEGVSALAVRVRRGRSGGHKNWRHYFLNVAEKERRDAEWLSCFFAS